MNTDTLTKTEKQPAANTETCQPRSISPRVDIAETKDRYLLRADLPGVAKDGLEILLENNELTIVGRRQPVSLDGELLYQESSTAEYRRTFSLDPAIDTAKITAKLDQGILTLELPKTAAVQPRKIQVTG